MVLQAAQLHDEAVRPIVPAADEEPRHDHGVRGGLAQPARPPLGGAQGGAVDHKLLRAQLISGAL